MAKPKIVLSRLPNPLLMVGAKPSDAVDLSTQILGEKHREKIASGYHPDVHVHLPEQKSGLHTISTVHKMNREMSLPPFEGKHKIFILEEVEKMLPPAANALLKALEEPSADTFFLLMTDHPQRLLPTVQSRVTPFTFSSNEIKTVDLSSYFAVAAKRNWDLLLDALSELEEDPEGVLGGCLAFARKEEDPIFFQKMAKLVAEGEIALQRNIKLRTVVLHILLETAINI